MDLKALARARAAVCAVFFADGAVLGSWITYIRTVELHLGVAHDTMGTALLTSALGAWVSMQFSGRLIHRFGSRNASVLSGLLLCLAIPWLLVVPTLPLFVVTYFLVGVFNGQMDVCMNAHSCAIQDRYTRPILSSVHGWWSIGGFAGGGIASLVALLHVPAMVHLWTMSGFMIALLLWVRRFMLPSGTDSQGDAAKFAFPTGGLLVLGLLAFCCMLTEGGFGDWSAVFIQTDLGSSQALGALGFTFFSGGMASGRLIGDGFVHRFGPAKVMGWSAFVAFVGMVITLTATVPVVAVLALGLIGLGIANTVPILFSRAGNYRDLPSGVGIAAVSTLGYTAFLAGPAVIGHLAHHYSLRIALWVVVALCTFVVLFGPGAVRTEEKTA